MREREQKQKAVTLKSSGSSVRTSPAARNEKDEARGRKNAELRDLATHIDAQLQAIRRHLRSTADGEVRRGNLTGPQQKVLSVIVRGSGVSVKEVSREVNLAHSTVSGIVDRLEARGMIERHTSKADGRMVELHPAPAVRKWMRDAAQQLAANPLVAALQRASKKERRNIARGVNTLERLLNGSPQDE